MDYKQLEAFSAVVKCSSFSKAADFLYLSQPTVSAHIASLEQELNTKLFLRNGRETIPTAAGEMLFAYSEKILQLREEAVKAVVDAQQNAIPSISIASSTVPSQLYLPKFMSSYREINPKAVFSVYHGDSDEAITMLLSEKVELAFAGKPADPRKCISVPFADDSLVVITPNNKRFQKMIGKPFPIIMLLLEPFISREKGSGTRMETESFLRSAGYDPKDITTVIETDSTQSIINHVSEGAGISIISSAASKEYASQGKILQFNPGGCSIDRHLYIIRRRHSTLSPSAKEFYKFVTALPHNKDA